MHEAPSFLPFPFPLPCFLCFPWTPQATLAVLPEGPFFVYFEYFVVFKITLAVLWRSHPFRVSWFIKSVFRGLKSIQKCVRGGGVHYVVEQWWSSAQKGVIWGV